MGIIKDAKSIAKRDPAARNAAEVFLLYPGLHALIYHKISSFFYRHKLFFLARWVSQIANRRTGIEIHPGAKIGEGLFIDHGHGVAYCGMTFRMLLAAGSAQRHLVINRAVISDYSRFTDYNTVSMVCLLYTSPSPSAFIYR